MTTLSGPQAAHWLGMSYPRFDHWVRRYPFASPTVAAHGPGTRRRFTMTDMARAAVLHAIDPDVGFAGARNARHPKPERMHQCAQALVCWPDLPRFLVVTDDRTYRADTEAAAVDIVLANPGVSTVVDVAKVVESKGADHGPTE